MGFKRLDPDDFVVSAQSITSTCWSGNATALTTFFTQSNQVASISGKYYTNVFNTHQVLRFMVKQSMECHY